MKMKKKEVNLMRKRMKKKEREGTWLLKTRSLPNQDLNQKGIKKVLIPKHRILGT